MTIIEKNIPAPVRASGMPSAKDLPFSEMEVGDSFAFDCANDLRASCSARIHGYASAALGKGKITTKQYDGGVRVWRVA